MVDGGEVIDRTIDSNNAISLQGEEQQENETDEQFEERVLNKRAAQMFYVIRTKLVEKENLMLSEFTHRSSKKMVSTFSWPGREREDLVLILFLISGCTKVLLAVGAEEVPGVAD